MESEFFIRSNTYMSNLLQEKSKRSVWISWLINSTVHFGYSFPAQQQIFVHSWKYLATGAVKNNFW